MIPPSMSLRLEKYYEEIGDTVALEKQRISSQAIKKIRNYDSNVVEILQKIEEKFIQAVQKVNSGASTESYKVAVIQNSQPLNGRDPFENESEYLPSYSLWIHKGPEMDYPYLQSNLYSKEGLFYVGEIVPCKELEGLKEMALTGEISSFEDIYTNWVDELAAKLTFFSENVSVIEETKRKVNRVFNQAIEVTSLHFQTKNYSGSLIMSQFYSPSSRPQQEYEPLMDCSYWVNQNNNFHKLIGRVKIIESWENFEQILKNETDLNDIFLRCSKEMKDGLDASFASIPRMVTDWAKSLFTNA